MYKSPIDIMYGEMRMTIDNDILKAVQEYNITVDKEELLKALQYDRDQYKKGFADGTRAMIRVLDRLREMKRKPIELCYDIPLIDSIVEIIKEEMQHD